MKTLKEFFSELDNTNSNVGVSLSEYAVEPKNKEDKEAKLKALQALLVDPTTAKDPQMKQAIQSRLAQLNASFIDPHEKNIPSPTSDNPVTTRVEEGHPADYKGWKYDIEYIEDEDTRKKLHSATKDGKRVSIDWSPYSTLTDDDYKLWIDLGMPDRSTVDSIGPIDKEDLLKLAKTKQGTHSLLQHEAELSELKRLSGLPVKEDKNG